MTAVDCGRYVVRNEHGEVPAELTGKTYCLLGSSGVGKTTLINVLLGKGALETGTVSGTGEGRHTTRVATLLRCLMARMNKYFANHHQLLPGCVCRWLII